MIVAGGVATVGAGNAVHLADILSALLDSGGNVENDHSRNGPGQNQAHHRQEGLNANDELGKLCKYKLKG